VAAKFKELKAEIARLKIEYGDEEQFADPATWPNTSADGSFGDKQPIGTKTIAEAIGAAVSQ